MTTQARDYRPKIISFQQSLAELKIASKQGILWPCHSFKVSIPSRRKKALNILEETILKLCATETCNTMKLSDITCLNNEIVKFIQYRLSQLNLLTNRFELTEYAKELLEQWESEPEEYMAGTVYVDLIGGSLLPMVASEAPKYENVLEASAHHAKFTRGTTGRRKKIRARRLRENDECLKNVPTSDDVVKTIRAFKRLHKRFSLLTENNIGLPPIYPKSEAITVQQESEMVFLHCSVIMQKGNPEFLVTDAFGYGFSSVFKESLSQKAKNDPNLDKWILRFKEKGLVQLTQDKNGVDPKSSNGVPSGFSYALFQYPEIEKRLNRAEINWKKANVPFSSYSQEQEFHSSVGKTLKYLYDALEWTFRQVVFENPVDHWEQIFSSQSYKENDRLLLKFAKKIGFTIPKSEKLLLQVKPGKIRAYSEGVVEIQPLLALAIAGASQDSQHPLNYLAFNDSNSLSFIAILKKLRDAIAHSGKINFNDIMQATSFVCTKCNSVFSPTDKLDKCSNCDHEELKINTKFIDDCRIQTHQIIMSLYPSLKCKTGEANKDTNVEGSDIDQLRLKARISIDHYFGISVVQMMPHSLSEELIRIELLWDAVDRDRSSVYAYINSLSSVLQISLFNYLPEHIFHIGDDINLKVMVLKNAIEANFLLIGEKLPQNLHNVNNKRVKQACSGSSSTLGANLLALLILMPKKELVTVARNIPYLLTLISRVIELRGHGNKSSEQILHELLDENELLSLKEKVFETVKILMEI